MRLLLDGGFPSWAEAQGTRSVTLAPLGPFGTDAEVFRSAAEDGCDAVVLLGRESLANSEALRAAEEAGIGVVVTHADDPIAATRALSDHLPALAAQAGPGYVVLVLADAVRQWPLRLARGLTSS